MAYNWTTEWPGVYARHASDCPLRNHGECTCQQVAYRASAKAPDNRSRVLSPEYFSAIEARDWLRDQRARVTAAVAVADEGPAVATVIQEFLDAAARGEARDAAGVPFSQARQQQLRDGFTYVQAQMGVARIQQVRRRDVQALVDQLDGAGLPFDRVIAVIDTLRELFMYAIRRDLADSNPIVQLKLPMDEGKAAPPLVTQPVPVMTGYVPAYNGDGNGHANGNGNGNGHVNPLHVTTASYAPPFTAAIADSPAANWTPGTFEAIDALDDPFEDELAFESAASLLVAEGPAFAPPEPVFGFGPGFADGASNGSQASPRAPWGAPYATPQPAAYTTPVPAFTAPAQAYTAPMPAAAGAQTLYGTPPEGSDALTMQAPVLPGDNGAPMMSEHMFWWVTRIVVIVFVLIALVLAAESI
jgi:hypothetical protein